MMRTVPTKAGYGLLAFLIFGTAAPAAGKDLNILVRVTYAAFLAEQGSSMCNLPRLPLSQEDRTIFLNTKIYSAWIKREISTGLSDEDIQYVLKSAADRAKGEMLQVISVLKSYPPEAETTELYRWCTGKMKDIAFEVVSAYVNQPDTIQQIINRAKYE